MADESDLRSQFLKKRRHMKVIAFELVALLTVAVLFYVFVSMSFSSYARRVGIDNPEVLRASYFGSSGLTPLFKYFILAGIALLIAVRGFAVPKYKYHAFLMLIISAWLVIFALQLYYGYFAFKTGIAIGCTLEVVALCVWLFVVFRSAPG